MMTIKHTTLALSLLALMGMGTVHAADGPAPHVKDFKDPHRSYTEDVTRTESDGKVFKIHTVQTANANGFERTTTMTNPDGKTATRTITAVIDEKNKTVTRTDKGTGFDGKSWNRTNTQQGWGDGPHHRGFKGDAKGDGNGPKGDM